MQSIKRLKGTVTELPRGGYLVRTKGGYIQFGSPPETIKDTMMLPQGVPLVFVLPRELFNPDKGISLAELEFPIYYNFFIRKKRTTIICTVEQSRRLVRVLREAAFGPIHVDASEDIYPGSHETVVPDLKKEMNYYKNFLFRDLLSFHFFKNSRAAVNGVTITVNKGGDFSVIQDRKKLAHIPGTFEYKARYMIGERLKEPYKPPLFGVTCLGPSHGFDPSENTSGYIVWLNHRGVMIDPPVNSAEWLTDSNVNPKFIDSIILTHCHADHDAGTFQKIMQESRINIYTTQTIMNSFLRKYSSLSDESIDYLKRLFNFHRVYLERPFVIHGAEFTCGYTLHSIPTIGFIINFQGRTFVYSSDHMAEPEVHKKLLEQGVIKQDRYEQFCSFPWDADVIYHESGIAPLHTSIKWLNSLPKRLQKKTVVYHITKKEFPDDTNLTLARFGIEHTLEFKVKPPEFEKTYELLGLLRHLDFTQDLPLEKILEFLLAIQEERYGKGKTIIRTGSRGDKFYIIARGNVGVYLDGLKQQKIYGAFEYFGEVGLISGKTAADVVAETDVVVYSMAKNKFLNFIAGTDFEVTLKNLVEVRNPHSWDLLSTSRFFSRLTSYQKTWLESVMFPTEFARGDILLDQGRQFEKMYILAGGRIEVTRDGKLEAIFKRGDFIGNFHEIDSNRPSCCRFKAKTRVELFAIDRKNMVKFADMNPGLIMKLKTNL